MRESFVWFGVTSFVVLWRCVSRVILLGGLRHLLLEDYLMALTFAIYINFIVWVDIQTKYPKTNVLPPTGTKGMTAHEIHDRAWGSVATFVIEQSMIMIQWGCKACMMIVYYRLTCGLKDQIFVKILMGYTALGFVVVQICWYGVWCRPFTNYFAVKGDNSKQCETANNHLIMSYVFNVSSDLAMLLIPIPLFLRLQLLWTKKLALCVVFSLGIFVVVAATLSRYYCFSHPTSILWVYWYVREASTALIVTNIPNCYTLIRKILSLDGFTIFGTYVSFHHGTRHTATMPAIVTLSVSPTGPYRRQQEHEDSWRSEGGKRVTVDEHGLEIWQHTQVTVEV
ncbi:hypothetical protein ASPZODRAFT_64565 [Penicilliopsis zonata CBS 506.65]|uniref:Rhodopsin domain-containing protein n=1 Tax=Penicilliopsis zonata CBS 506.65 TaxID=1073090 RepID=A0A1L9SL14_9EURO|nr:hypothetical protein ASPZODRAFT_64565 [Penicilliopsis zonata CBS 506.65]OJJ47860.1 hypothetical protein ASPZODRAFT_64565 [Penicilliopsis zonata CBS 506.65]